MTQMIKKGPGRPPYGTRKSTIKGWSIVDRKEAKTIRFIAALREEGLTYVQIVVALGKKGIKSRHGSLISEKQVSRILKRWYS